MLTYILSNLNIQTVLLGLLVVLIVYQLRNRFRYKLPPGPFGLPFIGNVEDLHLEIDSQGRLSTRLYDKCDDFNFPIVNFPFLCSNIPSAPGYGVYISQSIRYSRARGTYIDFLSRATRLTQKLPTQGYVAPRLLSSLKKFYGRHHALTDKYGISISKMSADVVMNAKFLHEIFVKYSKKYGPVFKVRLGPYVLVVLNDINAVTEALVKRKADFANRPNLHSVQRFTEGGKDIAFSNYSPTWKLHRKIALKALRNYLSGDQLETVLHASMDKCLPLMKKEAGPFNPEPFIDLMVFNILNAVCFGRSLDLDDPYFQRFMELNKNVNENIGKGFVEDMLPEFVLKFWTSKKYKYIFEMIDELLDIMRNRIQEHVDEFDPDNIKDFTDAMLQAKREAELEEDKELISQLTDVHIRQTIFDIFGAGIDTSRITLYFAVRYMAGLPEIQKKCQEEIDRVVGKSRYPGIKDRENLSYTEATLHEIMRLGLAAPMGVPHSALCDSKIGEFDVPKDTMVIINHWALHYDPKAWKDVEKFDPARFLDDKGKLGMKPESWLPFSAGRRVCLGETVAKPELHLIFACILQRFSIRLPEGVNPKVEIRGSGGIIQPDRYEIIIENRE